MKIYNTMTRKKEELVPINGKNIGIYACGPTVYNLIHIGNARPICSFDVLRRYLKYRGYNVKYVQNFTDVDDKIIKKSIEEGIPASEVSEKYIAEYFKDAHGLNVMDADVHPKVTQSMDIIIDIVKTLVEKGYAYESNGDVYFRTLKFKDYGKLSGMPIEDLQAGARIDISEHKENPLDFAVWKAAKEGEPYWESPWGKGRPGWHIECSAMSRYHIGDTIDIHCGGQDLIFPHHENEIAQSECATGCKFANYWMHNGYINIDNKKMSKSLGNFFTAREVAEKYGYETVRYMMVQAHYRSPINYCVELLDACKASLERLYNCRETLDRAIENAADGSVTAEAKELFNKRREQFITAMDDDLNTADAIAAVFELVRDINTMSASDFVSKQQLEAAAELFDELTGILGLLYNRKSENEIPQEILDLAEQRKAARKEKNFSLADELRDKISAMGYIIEETRQGTKITKK
ncbi:MAG TPA: cysteine--tRNA ligase [Ruminococcus sp.]|mgnify:FL=1|nr:cysteine--tRNA ligase [Ruminococcus sp.]HCR73682.1 cysteine--tRNA ligase [Ruminococcus sp.]